MNSDHRKAGPIIHTQILTNFTLLKRRFEKLIHVIPVNPVFKTQDFYRPLASFLGLEFAEELRARADSIKRKGTRRKRTE